MEDNEQLRLQLAEYKQRVNELEQSEARLKTAAHSIQLGTWDYDPVSGKLIWSDECKSIYGVTSNQTINFSFFADHIFAADKAFVKKAIQDAMDPAGSKTYDISYRIIRFDDNTTRWIRSQGQVYFTNEGLANRFIGTVLDITDQVAAIEKSAKLAAIVETSDDAIISKTLNSIITSWNKSAERIFGYTEEEMIGQSILKLIPPEREDEEFQILATLRSGKRVDHFETKRMTKTGNLLDVSLTISPIKDSQGNIIGLSKIARDITERKQEEMRKNDFIAMVSHELKTPLTSIKSYIQVLLAKADQDHDPFIINALTRADVQTRKMTSMIQDFLNLARLEEGKIQLSSQVFELDPVVKEIVNDMQLLSTGHTIKYNGCTDINVYADKDKIGQVLINLLSNAVKYSPKGGDITISCEKVWEGVKIAVQDNGIGISAEDQKMLFTRFYRVKNERMKTVSGFGIGLYLVAEILGYHNSRIMVESEEGKGSTFYFTLPVK